eukprot:TRINITY_DN12198_c0_g1_i1.p1 TRINITY_DN12198_c0_g1~~TRINITY_DN12198_c0_g1_i1.p1  ORF type:complete len:206 (-),score=48.25 TRINITY_DN12198_c0_g1_i1:39-626(-)
MTTNIFDAELASHDLLKTESEKEEMKKELENLSVYASEHWFTSEKLTRRKIEKEVTDDVTVIMDLLQFFGLDVDFYITLMIYVERYIKVVGKQDAENIFDILLVAALSTLKMWEDANIKNIDCARLFSADPIKLKSDELKFLQKLDYDLIVEPSQIKEFKQRVMGSKEGPLKYLDQAREYVHKYSKYLINPRACW